MQPVMLYKCSTIKVVVPAIALILGTLHETQAELTHGPLLGHATSNSARVWVRAASAGEYTLRYSTLPQKKSDTEQKSSSTIGLRAEAKAENDLCLVWVINGLSPNSDYKFDVLDSRGNVLTAKHGTFSTLHSTHKKGANQTHHTTIMFGSCANDKFMPKQSIWKVVADRPAPKALVLLGDTPYIDTTNLATQRRRYREFFGMKEMRTFARDTPIYATWDDHDFGRNDTNGKLKGKENSRRAFIEYHAMASYGDGENGIYTSFRRGAIEVFLLDTRWFAGTEPSPVDAKKSTLLGKAQWEWLRAGLLASDADVKILASGMIWNKSVRPGKKDHWGNYTHERDAIFKFIGENKINGVALVGGDIHRSRIVRHDTETLAGYPIHEFISSPLATRPMKIANQPHPGLIKDLGKPEVILEMAVNQATNPGMLTARFLGPESKVYFSFSLKIDAMKSPQW